MGRHRRNVLYLEPMADRPGLWRLWGEFNGAQIRKRGEFEKLDAIKTKLEQQLAKQEQRRTVSRLTWLSEEQLRDAEAAVTRSGAVRLLDRVIASERVMPSTAAVECPAALKDWIDSLQARKRFERTIEKNEDRVKQFLAASAQPKHLTDLTPEMVEAWVFRKGTAGYTSLTDARVIHAWLRHCVRRRWLALIPFEIDLKDLAQSARPKESPRILQPAQAGAMLEHAAGVAGGRLVAYTILVTWCMLRHAEAVRTTPALIDLKAKTPIVSVHPRKRGTPSYRNVTIPANVRPLLAAALNRHGGVIYSKRQWTLVREKAGVLKGWQENLLRHTGISYLYQQTGDMKDVCRQAGNSDDTSFRHYLHLPAEGAAAKFYGDALVLPAMRKWRAIQNDR